MSHVVDKITDIQSIGNQLATMKNSMTRFFSPNIESAVVIQRLGHKRPHLLASKRTMCGVLFA